MRCRALHLPETRGTAKNIIITSRSTWMWKKIDSIFCLAKSGRPWDVSRAHHMWFATESVHRERILQLASFPAFHRAFFIPSGNVECQKYQQKRRNKGVETFDKSKNESLTILTFDKVPYIKLVVDFWEVFGHHCPENSKDRFSLAGITSMKHSFQ